MAKMTVTVTITRDGEDEPLELVVDAENAEIHDVMEMLVSAAEMIVGSEIQRTLVENGATPEQATYATPLRVRLLIIETLLGLPYQEPNMVRIDT